MQQLHLFDLGRSRNTPRVRTDGLSDRTYVGALSHLQFEYDLCPALFASRYGWGPLLIAPDTNILIDVVNEFDRIEGTFGFRGEHLHLLKQRGGDRIDDLWALFILWFWRDVRFYVPGGYLTDSKAKDLSPERASQRKRVLGALGDDLFSRGGLERHGHDEDYEPTPDSWLRADVRNRELADRASDRITTLIPGNDGVLAADAAASGCHVFLTEDSRVLKRSPRLRAISGIMAMGPGELLDALGDAGELHENRMSNGGLAPDLQSFAHFYGLVSEAGSEAGP